MSVRLTTTALAAFMLAAPALAQLAPPTPAPATEGAEAEQTPANVDESALRYFAREGDLDRLESEIRRLKTLYPNWQPPDDLLQASGPRRDETQPIWDLYGAGRYAEAREAIARRLAADPKWQPPQELLTLLNEAEVRQRLVNASAAQQWNAVLTIAASAPGLLVCANMDVLWRVGEAFSKIGRTDRARDLYTYILQNCDDPAERLATMQRAATELPPEAIANLMRLGRKQPDGSDEFAAVRVDALRRELGAASLDAARTMSADDLAVLERVARTDTTPDDAILLGFYLYTHGDPEGAIVWFDAALKRGGGAKAAEGYVLAMRAAGRDLEAVPIAYEWRGAGEENLVAYLVLMTAILTTDSLAAQASQPMVDAFAASVQENRSPLGAQALGWYSYGLGQLGPAATWFANSLRWEPSEVAAYGLALVFQRARDTVALDRLLAEWTRVYPRLPALLRAPPPGATTPAAVASGYGGVAGTATGAPVPIVSPALQAGTAPVAAPAVPVAAGAAALRPAPDYGLPAPAAPATMAAAPAAVPRSTAAAAAAPAAVSRGRCATGPYGGMSASAALAAAWCLMELDRAPEAIAAFDRALGAGPSTTTGREAAYGKSLAYLRLGLTDEGAAAAAETPQTPQRRLDLGEQILNQRAVTAYQAGRYSEALLLLDERARLVPESYDLMMLRGWAYANLGHYGAARQLFEAVDTAHPTADSRFAIGYLNRKMGRRRE